VNINHVPDFYYDQEIRDKFLSLKGYLKKGKMNYQREIFLLRVKQPF